MCSVHLRDIDVGVGGDRVGAPVLCLAVDRAAVQVGVRETQLVPEAALPLRLGEAPVRQCEFISIRPSRKRRYSARTSLRTEN